MEGRPSVPLVPRPSDEKQGRAPTSTAGWRAPNPRSHVSAPRSDSQVGVTARLSPVRSCSWSNPTGAKIRSWAVDLCGSGGAHDRLVCREPTPFSLTSIRSGRALFSVCVRVSLSGVCTCVVCVCMFCVHVFCTCSSPRTLVRRACVVCVACARIACVHVSVVRPCVLYVCFMCKRTRAHVSSMCTWVLCLCVFYVHTRCVRSYPCTRVRCVCTRVCVLCVLVVLCVCVVCSCPCVRARCVFYVCVYWLSTCTHVCPCVCCVCAHVSVCVVCLCLRVCACVTRGYFVCAYFVCSLCVYVSSCVGVRACKCVCVAWV